MSNTTYPGIDYSGNQPINRNLETGIRYGIIPQNDVMPEALDNVFSNGRDLGFENAVEELKGKLRNAISDYFSDSKSGVDRSRLDCMVDNAFEAVDGWQDGFDCSGPYRYEQDGYTLQTDDSGDLWVFESLYFTYAQFCSPCAPGACYLSNPIDTGASDLCPICGEHITITGHTKDGRMIGSCKDAFKPEQWLAPSPEFEQNKCYCLGPDWFDNDKAPYRIWSVETGEEIV